jgi:preprotein translocase subunit SecA
VTISTNMAGRGTDIKLGEGVAELGGLFVLATERHESRRVDRQLRGRSARQGDPGESKFFLSFEDDLMRNFGAAERMTKMMERFGMKEGEELQHPWLNRSVETAQKRVEQRNYVWRKRVLEYDDVMNQQREVVYEWRNDVLNSNDTRLLINEAVEKGITERLSAFVSKDIKDDTEADYDGLLQWVNTMFPIGLRSFDDEFKALDFEAKSAFLKEKILNAYGVKVGNANPTALQEIEKMILLNAIDRLWQEHLYALDALKEGVSLRTYGQKDPLIEFKQEAFTIFAELMNNINGEVLGNLFRSTQQLAAFEQFLAQMAAQQSGESAAPQRREEAADGEEAAPNPGRDGPRLIIPSAARTSPSPTTARSAATTRVHAAAARSSSSAAGAWRKVAQLRRNWHPGVKSWQDFRECLQFVS